MWEIVYKYGFVIVTIAGITANIYAAGKGKYMRENSPIANGIGSLLNTLILIGFFLWCW
jgi:hypothetical protein